MKLIYRAWIIKRPDGSFMNSISYSRCAAHRRAVEYCTVWRGQPKPHYCPDAGSIDPSECWLTLYRLGYRVQRAEVHA